jgi:hypothetical protein
MQIWPNIFFNLKRYKKNAAFPADFKFVEKVFKKCPKKGYKQIKFDEHELKWKKCMFPSIILLILLCLSYLLDFRRFISLCFVCMNSLLEWRGTISLCFACLVCSILQRVYIPLFCLSSLLDCRRSISLSFFCPVCSAEEALFPHVLPICIVCWSEEGLSPCVLPIQYV